MKELQGVAEIPQIFDSFFPGVLVLEQLGDSLEKILKTRSLFGKQNYD